MKTIQKNNLKLIEYDILDVELLYNVFDKRNNFVGTIILTSDGIKEEIQISIYKDCLNKNYPCKILDAIFISLKIGTIIKCNEKIDLEDFKCIDSNELRYTYYYNR